MKTKRPLYQQGRIKRVVKANGYSWEVRFRETVNRTRRQRCETGGDWVAAESV